MSSAASAAENMLKSALLEAGYPDQSHLTSKALLLEVARNFRQGSMTKVEQGYQKKGKIIRWDVTPERFILDHIFSVDSLISPSGRWGQQFAFDVTLNSTQVTSKADKHRHLWPVWEKAGLGIIKSAVILLVPGEQWSNEWGWGLLNSKQKEDFVDEVLQVVYGIDERSVPVTTHIINF